MCIYTHKYIITHTHAHTPHTHTRRRHFFTSALLTPALLRCTHEVCVNKLYIYVNIHASVCMHTYIRAYIHTYIHTYERTHARTRARTRTHTHIFRSTHEAWVSISIKRGPLTWQKSPKRIQLETTGRNLSLLCTYFSVLPIAFNTPCVTLRM